MTGFVKKDLGQLFREIPVKALNRVILPELPVTGIVFDSRKVQPQNLFIAFEGEHTDGHLFISDAIKRGAAAIVGTADLTDISVPYIRVEDGRKAMAYLSAAFYGFPARDLMVIGVTGTDGKTTTCNLIYQILLSAGIRTGIVSTVNAVIGDKVLDTGYHVTTPEAPDVQRYLSRMVAAGLTHVVLETTSHGLAQERVTACDFNIGVVTNITHEHLDYHGSYEAYRDAKANLFRMVQKSEGNAVGKKKVAVLNRDDGSYDYLHELINDCEQVCYSLKKGVGDIWAENIENSPKGLQFEAVSKDFRIPIKSWLVGNFNVANCLAAIAATVIGLGVPLEAAQIGVSGLSGIPGRMERIDLGQNFTAIVDFAHTPNALERTLETARRMTEGRILAVFGSAGLRDRKKRRLMAEISIDRSDITILTAEDPRTESLESILKEMADAATKRGGVEGKNFFCIPDRGKAIRAALDMAEPGDIVLSCGKGHEQSMCFGETEYPWDDRHAMRAALADFLELKGLEMPYLPTQDKK